MALLFRLSPSDFHRPDSPILFLATAESLLLRQIRAKYESLQTELEYARQQQQLQQQQTSADAEALVAMTTRLDDADAEKRLLSDRCEMLQSQAEETKTSIRAKREAMEKEVWVRERFVCWAKYEMKSRNLDLSFSPHTALNGGEWGAQDFRFSSSCIL